MKLDQVRELGALLALRKMSLTTTAALTMTCFSSQALGKEDYVEEIDFLGDIPVVTFGTRLDQKVTDTPTPITIIGRDLIEASGATEVSQLLNLVPGYLASYVVGGQFAVTNRGITFEIPGDLEVMIDGRSVYEPLFSGVDWSSLGITVDDIQHIEVVRNSNAPAYGSNAFLGAINIVTTKPIQTQGVTIDTTVGDLQTRNANLRYSGRTGDLEYTAGITYRNNQGFPALSDPDPTPYHRIKDSHEALHFNFKSIYTPSLTDTIEFQFGIGESDYGVPDDDITADLSGANTREFKNNNQLLRWTRNTQKDTQYQIQLYHSRMVFSEVRDVGLLSDVLGAPPEAIPDFFGGHPDEFIVSGIDDGLSERYDLEIQHKTRLSPSQRLVWGIGARTDRVRSEFLFSTKDAVDESSYRLFGNWEWTASERWRVNVGAMLEHNSIVGDFASPRIGVNYQAAPNQIIRVSFTQGHRTPSVLEANQFQVVSFMDGTPIDVDVMAAPDLDKSSVMEYEIGYLGNFYNNKLSIDLRYFNTKVDDALIGVSAQFPDISNSITVTSNGADWTTTGFESQIRLQLSDSFFAALEYAYTDFTGTRLKRSSPVIETNPLGRELPDHNFSLLISKRFPGDIQASVVWYYLPYFAWRQGAEVPDSNRLDARLAKDFRFGNVKGKAELIAHNLLNEFEEYEDFNTFETRVFFKISLNFQ